MTAGTACRALLAQVSSHQRTVRTIKSTLCVCHYCVCYSCVHRKIVCWFQSGHNILVVYNEGMERKNIQCLKDSLTILGIWAFKRNLEWIQILTQKREEPVLRTLSTVSLLDWALRVVKRNNRGTHLRAQCPLKISASSWSLQSSAFLSPESFHSERCSL